MTKTHFCCKANDAKGPQCHNTIYGCIISSRRTTRLAPDPCFFNCEALRYRTIVKHARDVSLWRAQNGVLE